MTTRSTPFVFVYHISRNALLSVLEEIDDDEIRFVTSVLRLEPAETICVVELTRDTGACFVVLGQHRVRIEPGIRERDRIIRIRESVRSPTLAGH